MSRFFLTVELLSLSVPHVLRLEAPPHARRNLYGDRTHQPLRSIAFFSDWSVSAADWYIAVSFRSVICWVLRWACSECPQSVLWLVDNAVGGDRPVITDIHNQRRDNRATAVSLSDASARGAQESVLVHQGFQKITESAAEKHCSWCSSY